MRIPSCLALAMLAGCILDPPPGDFNPDHGPIEGIVRRGDGPREVVKRLGMPTSKANGWWRGSFHYDEGCPVWYYKGVGRVVFNWNSTLVIATEADSSEDGRP